MWCECCSHGPAGSNRKSRSLRRCAALVVCAVASLLLQGCQEDPGCKIRDVYPLLQLNGRKGFTELQLRRAGVTLCARHTARKETYQGDDACSPVDEVFPGGELPEIVVADSQALLLVKCPAESYLQDAGLQRVTCASELYFDEPDGELKRALTFHFDSSRHPAGCLTRSTGWEKEELGLSQAASEEITAEKVNVPEQILLREQPVQQNPEALPSFPASSAVESLLSASSSSSSATSTGEEEEVTWEATVNAAGALTAAQHRKGEALRDSTGITARGVSVKELEATTASSHTSSPQTAPNRRAEVRGTVREADLRQVDIGQAGA